MGKRRGKGEKIELASRPGSSPKQYLMGCFIHGGKKAINLWDRWGGVFYRGKRKEKEKLNGRQEGVSSSGLR